MNLGTIATIGREMPENLVVVVWDNEAWAQTGGQPSHTSTNTNLEDVAKSCGISKTTTVDDLETLEAAFGRAMSEPGPWFIVAKIEEAAEYMPVAPVEPEFTLYRFRNTYVGRRRNSSEVEGMGRSWGIATTSSTRTRAATPTWRPLTPTIPFLS